MNKGNQNQHSELPECDYFTTFRAILIDDFMNSYISKYNISESDLKMLCSIEVAKAKSGYLQREKLKAKTLGVLKPYNVKFMDLGELINEVKALSVEHQADLTETELAGVINQSSSWGLQYIIPAVVVIVAIAYVTFVSFADLDPSKKQFYKLSESKPYRFDAGGLVETWDQGDEYWDKSCSSQGRWRVEGEVVIVSGVSNPNCPWMSERNGRFKIEGDYLERE